MILRANAIGINGTHERQERYANTIVKLMRPYFKIRNTFSRDYEGNPTSGAVNIPVRKMDVNVRDYDVKNGISLEQSATNYLKVLISKDKAINELIDGYEASAVPDNLMAQRLESAAYSTAKVFEESAIKALVSNSTISTQADCTADNIYSNIVKDTAILAKRGVDKNRMFIAVSFESETLLLQNKVYANTASQIGAELARNGIVNKINGVNVITQDLGVNEAGQAIEYIIYGIDWTQAIDEWKINPVVVDLTTGSSEYVGASALKGRMVYEDVVTDSNAVIVKSKVGISAVEITPVETLSGTLADETKVADLASVGGSGTVTYSLPTGVADNDKFEISTNTVITKDGTTGAGTYTIVVKGTDTASNEASATATINVAEATE